MTKLADLPTLILNHRVLAANLDHMRAGARQLDVTLWPRLKTAKSGEVARLAPDHRLDSDGCRSCLPSWVLTHR